MKVGYTALLVKDGVLYAVADTGKLYAYDAKTGEALWDYSIGTVGKGSPIWADGKLYVMEVNGNIHILKANRGGCESLSKNSLKASAEAAKRGFKGMDEIYASPAVSNGKVVFVTRDRTICIGKEGWKSSPAKPMMKERDKQNEIAHLKLVPFETVLTDGGEVEYRLRAYDKNGVFIKEMPAEGLSVAGLADAKADGAKIMLPKGAKEQAGEITAKVGELTATARLRVFGAGPWKWDFTGYKPPFQVPPTWVNATKKLFPANVEGEACMRKKSTQTGGKGRPSAYLWLGPSDMKDYTVQADVRLTESRRRIPAVGVTVHRYNFILDGNKWKLKIQSWAPHRRMAKEIKFKSKTDVWYTMKATCEIVNGEARIKGKVWEKGKEEPADWSLEAVDPHPNPNGSPGLYFYSLADSFIDNVSVTPNK